MRRDAQGLVQGYIGRRAPADLRPVRHLADLSQNVFRRDGARLERPQIFAAFIDGGVSIVDEEPRFYDSGRVDLRRGSNAGADHIQMHPWG